MKKKEYTNKMPAVKKELSNGDKLLELNQSLQKITADPDRFLLPQPEKYHDIEQMLQSVYGITIDSDIDNADNPEVLPELVVEDMDEEQIWQQLEIRNSLILKEMIQKTARLMALREHKLEVHLKENNEDELDAADEDMLEGAEEDDISCDDYEPEDEVDQSNEDVDDSMEEDEVEQSEHLGRRKEKPKRKSVVDDKFFKLDEMEAFLEAEEAKEARKEKGKLLHDDQGINYFAEDLGEEGEDESEDEDSNPNYRDFFNEEDNSENEHAQPKKSKKSTGKDFFDIKNEDIKVAASDLDEKEGHNYELDMEEDRHSDNKSDENNINENTGNSGDDTDSEAEANVEDSPKSSFELKQSRLDQRIREYEEEVLGEKPWQLKGEVQATNRPQNSLLEEVLEFESTVRPAPVITEETTRCLEDIIRQRIKDKAWDDVVRTVKPIHTPQEYRKQLVLDQEKSKESLAHIYEKEYQQELDKLNPNREENEAEEPKDHKEIRNLMRDLFIKLDALSNFHFTPKPVAPEPKIITNTPAVSMEEVAPVAASSATLLAPEEVFRGPKHELVGKSERSKTDKNRAIRKKKSKQRSIHKAMEAKDIQKQKMGIPLSKKEESAKLMKKLTKQRNVDKITSSNDLGALKSSKAFFSKLQDQSVSGNPAKGSKKKADPNTLSAKQLKL